MNAENSNTYLETLEDLFLAIAQLPQFHATSGPIWRLWNRHATTAIANLFKESNLDAVRFGPFGELVFPYVEMGAINSLDLFGTDELILFSFYWANRKRYRKVVDFGANIGLHSTVLSRCGYEVRCFEPDPVHLKLLKQTFARNDVNVEIHNSAISFEDGEAEFVRVLGNTTGSHLSGAKPNPYGELERFKVPVEAAQPHLQWADLAKIDIEGHEAALIKSLPADIWLTTDAVLEVGTAENAKTIFEYLDGTGVNMFSQKVGWNIVETVEDVPTSHREGSLFLTGKAIMPWS